MSDSKESIQSLSTDFKKLESTFDLNRKKARIAELEKLSSEKGFWDNRKASETLMQEFGDLKREVKDFEELKETIDLLHEFVGQDEAMKDLAAEVRKAQKSMKQMEIASYLSDMYDKNNSIISIHAGQGGTEAMDWTNMLYRMYTRYFDKKKWKYDILDMTSGEEAGLKGVSILVKGAYVYGYLKREAGTHRLVRQSPFNADNLRQTSFALVEVMPELKQQDASDIAVNDEDLDWQFFRSSGSGGQNVNKVSTAVRLTHKPTGIVVSSQTQRHQEQNRNNALSLLRSKLWIKKQEERKSKVKSIKGEYQPASWGTQIRSYVLHPYKMVKDLRTEVESSNPDAVLDGDLDEFVEAEVRMRD